MNKKYKIFRGSKVGYYYRDSTEFSQPLLTPFEIFLLPLIIIGNDRKWTGEKLQKQR